jgi:hypothetical protein
MRKANITRFTALFLVVLIAAMALFTGCKEAETQTGAKTITVEIIVEGAETVTKTIQTEAEFLRGALDEEEGLVIGEEGPYGLFIKTVNGVTADDSKQQWWCITKGGEAVMSGVDTTPVADGDQFELTLTTGW